MGAVITPNELFEKMKEANLDLIDVLSYAEYRGDGEADIQEDWTDPQGLFMKDMLLTMLRHADALATDITYLENGTLPPEFLKKGEDGLYMSSIRTYHSGSTIEYLEKNSMQHTDPDGNPVAFWKLSRIEYSHDLNDYCIVGHDGPIEGLTIRERRE